LKCLWLWLVDGWPFCCRDPLCLCLEGLRLLLRCLWWLRRDPSPEPIFRPLLPPPDIREESPRLGDIGLMLDLDRGLYVELRDRLLLRLDRL